MERHIKILIIEDERLIASSVAAYLTKHNFETFISNSGRDGINAFKLHHYDLIICDLMLNDITGLSIIDEYRSIYPNVDFSKKFLIVTAYSSSDTFKKAEQLGCKIIKKPFNGLQALVKTIKDMLNEA